MKELYVIQVRFIQVVSRAKNECCSGCHDKDRCRWFQYPEHADSYQSGLEDGAFTNSSVYLKHRKGNEDAWICRSVDKKFVKTIKSYLKALKTYE